MSFLKTILLSVALTLVASEMAQAHFGRLEGMVWLNWGSRQVSWLLSERQKLPLQKRVRGRPRGIRYAEEYVTFTTTPPPPRTR
jgi:hypothetical protein